MAQVCRIIHQDHELHGILNDSKICKRIGSESESEFPRVQLIEGAHLDQIVQQLIRRIAVCVVNKPPYCDLWQRFAEDQQRRDMLVRIMTDIGIDASEMFQSHMPHIQSEHKADLLAFRALLARGILVHCLKMRFRVGYGLKHDGVKLMAVPYRASDTPSEKSEFSQPDCAIVLTYLSYYYDGVSMSQVRACMCVCV